MHRRGKPSSAIHANMTPMIDVTFLLIVFFVVVSQIVDRDAVSMDLPIPTDAASEVPAQIEHVTINIVPYANGDVAGIVVGGHTISHGAWEELKAIVQTRLRGGAEEVHIRADKSTHYEHIHQVIEAIRELGTSPRLQLIVEGERK